MTNGMSAKSERTVEPHAVPRLFDMIGWSLGLINAVDRSAYKKLIAAGKFHESRSVLEIGGGTGRLAAYLLAHVMPAGSRYCITEVSPVLWHKMKGRFSSFGDRVSVSLVQHSDSYPFEPRQFERIIATYVHDLMPTHSIQWHIDRAHCLLADGGMICLLTTANGRGACSSGVMAVWRWMYRLHPAIVGGSRPINMMKFLHPGRWTDVTVDFDCKWGFASEVITARKLSNP